MKRILITGANSYIGTSFETYMAQFGDEYTVDTVDMIGDSWKSKDFSGYDCVFHVAGIAHQKETLENAHLYYEVNRNLAVATAKKAKRDGVKQFILLSSMSVYGLETGVITKNTVPNPKSHYGKSKLQADEKIVKLDCDTFKVAILRPPMVYGKDCKGNFQSVVKLAEKLPVFPKVNNQRSLIYIDNLASFVKLCIDNCVSGTFFPQDRHYVNTSAMAKAIASAKGKELKLSSFLGLGIVLARPFVTKIKKAFGSLQYCDTEDFNYSYCIKDTKQALFESIIGRPEDRKNNQPLVSLITVTFNSEKTLARTIRSVLNQTYRNIEYTIMDGCSTDKTVEIAKSYRNEFEQKGITYRIISEPDNGMYDAINKAIELSDGLIIGNVNSDDYYEKDAVEIIVDEYNKAPYDMIYGDLRIIKPSGNTIKKAKLKRFVSTRFWNHPTTFITKETYNKEKYKCESIYDDCDLMLRLRKKGYRVRVVNKILSNFTFGGMSTKKDWNKTKQRIRIRCQIYENNGYGLLYKIDSIAVETLKYLLG